MPTLKPRRRPESGAGGNNNNNNTVRAGVGSARPDGTRSGDGASGCGQGGQSNRNRPRLQSYTNVDRTTDDEGGAASAAAATKKRKASGGNNNNSGGSSLAEESLAPPAKTKARKSSSGGGENRDVATWEGAAKSACNAVAVSANAASMYASAPSANGATGRPTSDGGGSIGIKGEIQLYDKVLPGSSSLQKGRKFRGELSLRAVRACIGGTGTTDIFVSMSEAASADSSLQKYCDKKVIQAEVLQKESDSQQKRIRPRKIRVLLKGGELGLAVKPQQKADLVTPIEFLLEHGRSIFTPDGKSYAEEAMAYLQQLEEEMATRPSAFGVESGMEGHDEKETQGISSGLGDTAAAAARSRGTGEDQLIAENQHDVAEEADAEAKEAARLAEEARLEQERIAAEKAAAEEAADHPPPTEVEVQFKCDKADQSIVSIILGLDERFSTAVQQYAMRVKLDAGSLRFLYDGVRIESKTPADLELHLKTKEDCVVDVVVEQIGG